MDEQITKEGVERRSFLKGAAAVAGATVWATPTIQSLVSPAAAAVSVPCDPYVGFKIEPITVDDVVTGWKIDDADPDDPCDELPHLDSAVGIVSGQYLTSPQTVSGATGTWTFTITPTGSQTPQDFTVTAIMTNGNLVLTIQGGDARDIDISGKAGADGAPECNYANFDGVADATYQTTIDMEKDVSHVTVVMCIVVK